MEVFSLTTLFLSFDGPKKDKGFKNPPKNSSPTPLKVGISCLHEFKEFPVPKISLQISGAGLLPPFILGYLFLLLQGPFPNSSCFTKSFSTRCPKFPPGKLWYPLFLIIFQLQGGFLLGPRWRRLSFCKIPSLPSTFTNPFTTHFSQNLTTPKSFFFTLTDSSKFPGPPKNP